MRRIALYEYAWVEAHRPVPVPGLFLDLQAHWVHSVSSNPVMREFDVTTVHDSTRQVSYKPMMGDADSWLLRFLLSELRDDPNRRGCPVVPGLPAGISASLAPGISESTPGSVSDRWWADRG